MRRRSHPVRCYMEEYERIQDIRGARNCDSARAIELEFMRADALDAQVSYLTATLAKAERERNQWKSKCESIVKCGAR